MPNPATYSIGPFAAGNASNIVAANTPGGAGNLAIVGGSFAADAPRRVGVTLGAEAASRSVLVVGTNEFGQPIQELMVCKASTVTVSVQNFATVTRVAVFAAFTVAMSVGTVVGGGANPVASTPWFAVDIDRIPTDIGYQISETGTLTGGFNLEITFDDVNAGYLAPGASNVSSSVNPQSNVPPAIFSDPTFGAAKKTTSPFVGSINYPCFAIRASIYDTTPDTLQFQVIQAGLRGA